ncbi:hypothetical protein [Burkholderia gladioli]|uniref:hypothetical protein n=1 Tax=Burkholderia gladioli TaxID=28095 RepID=UPI001641803D|nr:hypothetical protein [Burkholderia gladioli]
MNTVIALAAQFLLPMPIGYAIALYLRAVTRRLLVDMCGTEQRADFWTRIVMVMLVLGPLTLSLAFGRNPAQCSASELVCLVGALRTTLATSLFGAMLPLMAIALRISRQIPRDADPSAPGRLAATPAATERPAASA